VLEALGAKVHWDKYRNTLVIKTPAAMMHEQAVPEAPGAGG